MKGLLEEITSKLERDDAPVHQFVSALLITCCIEECHIHCSLKIKEFVIPLLRMLNIKSDIKQKVAFLMDIPRSNWYIALLPLILVLLSAIV